MAENFANNYSTAIDETGGIDASQTTFDVLSLGGAPAVNFRIKVENELMLVTGVSSPTLTVTRGIESTTAATHADGTLVTHVVTAAALDLMMPGDWTDYTPTWTTSGTSPSIGNGTLAGRYRLIAPKTYLYRLQFTAGSTTTFGTGAWSFSLPWTASSSNSQELVGRILDTGTDNKLAAGDISPSGSTIAQITAEGSNTITNTAPMTWANGDMLILQGWIEIA
jgi:hypothetical protein